MRVPPSWIPRLEASGARKVMLLSVARRSLQLAKPNRHTALLPGAIRIATDLAEVANGTEIYPFWPYILNWPEIVLSFSPTERDAPTASADVSISAQADFPRVDTSPGSPNGYHARLDLWTDGIDLDDVIALVEGPVVNLKGASDSAAVQVTVDDGLAYDRAWPTGELFITSGNFPNAPDAVIGKAPRQTIFGPITVPIPCHPIDQEGREFYFCDPPASIPPDRFYENGALTSKRVTTVPVSFPQDTAFKYTKVVFDEPVDLAGGYLGVVSAQGGYGIAVDPISTFLETIGGYELTQEAKKQIEAIKGTFNFSAFFNSRGSVLEIVRDRLLPQTDLVLGFQRGRIHLYRLFEETRAPRMGVGQGLRGLVSTPRDFADLEGIYNVIEISYQRNISSEIASVPITRSVITQAPETPGKVGKYLTRSQDAFGRRELPDAIVAADLVPDETEAGVMKLAEVEARRLAFPARPFTYDAEWLDGLRLERNGRVRLVDMDDRYARVVEIRIPATGPRVTVELEEPF